MVLWLYGKDASMKTTIEIPDELYRRAKSEAALSGRKLRNLVEEGLRLRPRSPAHDAPPPEPCGPRQARPRHDRLPGFPTSLRIPSIWQASAAMTAAIVDTGPLVAFFDRAEQRHHLLGRGALRRARRASSRVRAGARRSDVPARALSKGAGRSIAACPEWGAERRLPN